MPSTCVVPNCSTNKSRSTKASCFKVPKDENQRAQWEASIPGIDALRSSHVVCEIHFEEESIIRSYVKHDDDGNLLLKYNYQRPRLRTGAVPTIFDQSLKLHHGSDMFSIVPKEETNLVDPLHESVSDTLSHSDVNGTRNHTVISECHSNLSETQVQNTIDNNSNDIINFIDMTPTENSLMHTSDDEKSIMDNNGIGKSSVVTGSDLQRCNPIHLSMSVGNCNIKSENHVEHVTSVENCDIKSENDAEHVIGVTSGCMSTAVTFDNKIVFNIKSRPNEVQNSHVHLDLPKPWSLCKSMISQEEVLIFTYATKDNNCPEEKFIFDKTVILKASGQLSYQIYFTPADVTKAKLPRFLEDVEMLPQILRKFRDIRTCKGVEPINLDNISVNNSIMKNCGVGWRHKNCTMISISTQRCEACKKYFQSLSSKQSRLKKKILNRSSSSVNSRDQLQARPWLRVTDARKRLYYQTKQAKYLKLKVDKLTSSLGDDRNQIANLTDAELQNVDANEKVIIKEIVAAAKVRDPKGRRYTDEFLMLCMLMNIRSPSYYEFLRKNNIIPLPSKKLIRNYMTMMNKKCGFADEFSQLLQKSYSSEPEQKRHDEINLRTSVAVSTKTRTLD